MPLILNNPTLQFAVHEDGTLAICSPWFPLVAFSGQILAHTDGERLELRGDELTIHCTNGGATYTLGPANARGDRPGRLRWIW